MSDKTTGETFPLDYELRSKSGELLRFGYTENVEGTNRCFMVDEISAYLGDHKAGYLLVENVPGPVFEAFCPSMLHYTHRISGRILFLDDTETQPLEQLSVVALQKLAHQITFGIAWPGKDMSSIQSYEDFARWMKRDIEKTRWFAKHQADYDQFKAYHVDRPQICYVNTKGDLRGNRGLFGDFSGQGIGLALYQVAAMELERRGLEFNLAIDTASPDAKFMHDRFEKAGWLVRYGDRIRLDGAAIAAHLNIDLGEVPETPSNLIVRD